MTQPSDSLAPLASPALAYDRKQRRFMVPPEVAKWRVCRQGPTRGSRPRPLNGATGPVFVDADADVPELAEAVGQIPGWYVLYPVDRREQVLDDVPRAYVEIVPRFDVDDAFEGIEAPSPDPTGRAVDQLARALHQTALVSAQREQAMVGAFTEMATNVFAGFAQLQESTASLVTAVQRGYDIAAGVSLQKQPPTPAPPPTPDAPPQKTFLDFLCSPAGNMAISAFGGMVKAAIGDD